MILQLEPMIGMITPKGCGHAAFLIDYGLESDLYWVVLQNSGEIWTWQNKDVRLQDNITSGRCANEKGDFMKHTPVWDKPNPKEKSKKLTSAKKADAKARAKKAGRPYPNLIDNMAAARKK